MNLAAIPFVVWLHLAAAIVAIGFGTAQLLLMKGTPGHRGRGWIWLIVMYAVAGSSLFIQALRPGHYSWIHLLSLWTLFTLSAGLYFVRRGDVRRHRDFMVGTCIGLLIAGGFAAAGSDRLLRALLF